MNDAEFEKAQLQWEADLERNKKKDALFDLHITLVNLCVADILTEDEHTAFEDILDKVLDRIDPHVN